MRIYLQCWAEVRQQIFGIIERPCGGNTQMCEISEKIYYNNILKIQRGGIILLWWAVAARRDENTFSARPQDFAPSESTDFPRTAWPTRRKHRVPREYYRIARWIPRYYCYLLWTSLWRAGDTGKRPSLRQTVPFGGRRLRNVVYRKPKPYSRRI